MTEFEFVDHLPPTNAPWDTHSRRVVERFAEELRANPGRWAVYPRTTVTGTAARALVSRINRGRVAAFAKGFAAVHRGGVVYVRFEGVRR